MSSCLTMLERQALLIGLDDAKCQRKVVARETESRLQKVLGLVFGRNYSPPLADLTLDAFRRLAMRNASPRRRQVSDHADVIEPAKLLAALSFLAARTGTPTAKLGAPRKGFPTASFTLFVPSTDENPALRNEIAPLRLLKEGLI